jgi:2,4-diketo-3-deoxy-L-fuconate hydrolase
VYLMRVGPPGHERPVVRVDAEAGGAVSHVVDDVDVADVSDVVDDLDEGFFAAGGVALLQEAVAERTASGTTRPLAGLRVGPPIARPHQIICIGLNYRDHAAETGQPVPTEPVIFNKAPNTLTGPHDEVCIPRGSTKTDWEVKLGVVVGSRCRYLADEDAARAAIAGYVVVNDVSERELQLERGGQWVKGKSAETFNPCGPYLVTPDEVPDVGELAMWLDVNGVRRQDGSTGTMLFSPAAIVHYLSQFMVLEPGDLINTGTPPGVGLGFDPPVYLRPGDVVELGIARLGRQRQRVTAAR